MKIWFSAATAFSWWSLTTTKTMVNAQISTNSFDNCDIGSYYSGLSSNSSDWDRNDIQTLLYKTHRNVLPATNPDKPGTDDVLGALMDVDGNAVNRTVSLIYEDTMVPATPYGDPYWINELLWPLLRGIGLGGPDVTDIYNIRPSSPLASQSRGSKYFGECGVLVKPDTCELPAQGGAADTCSCNRLYTPPAKVKGDIARALMYMDVRYDGNNFDDLLTLNLRLTDCPFQPERDMAYLSQMLTWHFQDPPSPEELERNTLVCSKWQGNRNPFVDYPNLATQIFGDPLPLPTQLFVDPTTLLEFVEPLIYEPCKAIPTLGPTFAANSCDLLEPLDVTFWLVNTGTEPPVLGMYSFVPMDPNFEFFITNNDWNGNEFTTDQGTIKFTAPLDGLQSGSIFGYGDSEMPRNELFSLVGSTPMMIQSDNSGDPLYIYCLSANGDPRPITVFNNGFPLLDPLTAQQKQKQKQMDSSSKTNTNDTTTTMTSDSHNIVTYPSDLQGQGVIDLPHFINYLYIGKADVPAEALKPLVLNPANWEGNNNVPYSFHSRQQASSSGGATVVGSRFPIVLLMGTILFLTTTTIGMMIHLY